MRLGNVLAHKGYIQDVYKLDKKGRFFLSTLGSGEQWHPWIHIADAVNLIIKSIENEDVHGVSIVFKLHSTSNSYNGVGYQWCCT